MIKNLYKEYFQKSKTFLFPALQIARKSSIQVSNVFISWEGMYKPEDRKLVLVYDDIDSPAFQAFETKVLCSNPLFFTKFRSKEGKGIYVYDFNILHKDWEYFLEGKYSKLSKELKKSILEYYGKKSSEYEYIASYLFPAEFYSVYAELLDVHIDILEKVGELCDPYNPQEETCKISVELLESSASFI